MALIGVSALSYTLESASVLSPGWKMALDYSEVVIVIVFTVEYFVRIAIAERRLRYCLTPFALIDLAAILPFYISFFFPVADLRFLRVVRLITLFKILRFTVAMRRVKLAFVHVQEELILFSAGVLILMFLAASGMHYLEGEAQPEKFGNVLNSLWWAVVTFSAIGDANAYPVTAAGKALTGVMAMMGLIIISVPAGLFATAMLETKDQVGAPSRSGKALPQGKPHSGKAASVQPSDGGSGQGQG